MPDVLNASVKLCSKAAILVENIFNGGEALDNFPRRQRRAECNLARIAGSAVGTPGALPHKPSAPQAFGRQRARTFNIAVALVKGRKEPLSRLSIGTSVKCVILYLVECRFKCRDDICKILARDKRR